MRDETLNKELERRIRNIIEQIEPFCDHECEHCHFLIKSYAEFVPAEKQRKCILKYFQKKLKFEILVKEQKD